MEQKITPSIATKIKSMYQSGIFELTFEDVEKMRLIPGDDIIIKPNLFLERQFLFKLYKIKILNDQKDIEGRWLDEYVDFERIIKVLIEFKISMKTLSEVNEISLNKSLEKHFKNYFVNAHMSSGKQRSYFDLVIGNMNFVIEIKLAKALKNTGQMQKAIGQIDRYKSASQPP